MTFEDSMTIATKNLRDRSAEMLDAGDFRSSIAIDDAIHGLEAGVVGMQQRLAALGEPLADLVETAITIDPPAGCRVAVSVIPDIYVERPDGHWVGFRTGSTIGADGQPTAVWIPCRCSWPVTVPMRVGTLQELVDFYGQLES